MSMLDNSNGMVGCRMKLKTNADGWFEGILKGYCHKSAVYSFTNVKLLDGQNEEGEYFGVLNVYEEEIEEKDILEEPDREDTRSKQARGFQEPRLQLQDEEDEELVVHNLSGSESEDDEDENYIRIRDTNRVSKVDEEPETEPWIIEPELLKHPSSNEVYVFQTHEEASREAFCKLERCTSVGFTAFGEISRFGYLDYLAFSTEYGNMLFLVRKELLPGLKIILESEKILKVMHACCFISDALKNLHGIKLSNVYDTQVVDAFIRQKQDSRNRMPKDLRTYEGLAHYYLHLSIPYEPSYKCLSNDHNSLKSQNFIRRRLLLLKEIRWVQEQMLMKDINEGVKVFVECYRSASVSEYHSLMNAKDSVSLLFTQKDVLIPTEPEYSDVPFISSSNRDKRSTVRLADMPAPLREHYVENLCVDETEAQEEQEECTQKFQEIVISDNTSSGSGSRTSSSEYVTCPSSNHSDPPSSTEFVHYIKLPTTAVCQGKEYPTFKDSTPNNSGHPPGGAEPQFVFRPPKKFRAKKSFPLLPRSELLKCVPVHNIEEGLEDNDYFF